MQPCAPYDLVEQTHDPERFKSGTVDLSNLTPAGSNLLSQTDRSQHRRNEDEAKETTNIKRDETGDNVGDIDA